ncbi:MAG: tetratricopeptide repeat protein [Candidatus Moduliflexus flocculans]|nr:tetratricopeptide repeat protein [Candidatus Moduliflexus flocculans]
MMTIILAARPCRGPPSRAPRRSIKAGLYEEEVGGDLQKAIAIYQDLLKRFPGSREVAAKAQLHIGLCYEKLGTREAEKAFQRVIDNYPGAVGCGPGGQGQACPPSSSPKRRRKDRP